MQKSERDYQLQVAVAAAREAGAILCSAFGPSQPVRFKGQFDLVTDADQASERAIVGRLSTAFPRHQIVAEEGTGHDGDGHNVWLIDPLDGTTNFAHGYPLFSAS